MVYLILLKNIFSSCGAGPIKCSAAQVAGLNRRNVMQSRFRAGETGLLRNQSIGWDHGPVAKQGLRAGTTCMLRSASCMPRQQPFSAARV